MNRILLNILAIIFLLSSVSNLSIVAQKKVRPEFLKPKINQFFEVKLAEAKVLVDQNSPITEPAFKKLIALAEETFTNGTYYSVVDKKFTPPSGDKHDYMSLGPYWWPNPETEDGLPYIRKDGIVNPERNEYDRRPMWLMENNIITLTLAYYFTKNGRYAERTAKLVNYWFLNPDTKMNPHFKYAQSIPGKTDGRGIGIIDARGFLKIIEAVKIIDGTEYWTEKNNEELILWFKEFLNWLLTSKNGADESAQENNHGTWYDVIVSQIALFVGDEETAKSILYKVPAKRIDTQIEPNGTQPHELKRTRSFHYCTMNLHAFFNLAFLSEKVGIDLWNYESSDGRSIKAALDYLIPYALQKAEWQYSKILGWEDDLYMMYYLLRVASEKYSNPSYEKALRNIMEIKEENNIVELIYPASKTNLEKIK
jgi:alginate lyase